MTYENNLDFARGLDGKDPLASYREAFTFPDLGVSQETLYLNGNSLGLPPKAVSALIAEEIEDWGALGVLGHTRSRRPWYGYHEQFEEGLCQLVGARPGEVVAMNTLSVNLHLMLVSFYQPQAKRTKVIMEANCFPSDRFAVQSQIRWHGLDPEKELLLLAPREGEHCLRTEDIVGQIQQAGDSLALVLLGNVNYLTGEAFAMAPITQAAQAVGAYCGWDLAHGVGNLELKLHEIGADFAVWCHYKYLNCGPGAVAGAFVHERHARDKLPRFSGWWSHDKKSRMKMAPQLELMEGAEGWQLSNPPIFSLTPLIVSLELFQSAGLSRLVAKRDQLTGYLEFLLEDTFGDKIEIITPKERDRRGAQLSIRLPQCPDFSQRIESAGVICDFRSPDIVRVAPAPLYNSFEDVFRFVERTEQALAG